MSCLRRVWIAGVLVSLAIACSNGERSVTAPSRTPVGPIADSPPGTNTSPPPTIPAPPAPPVAATATVLVVGDIGMCSERDAVQRVGDLVARLEGRLLLAGDLAYMNGTLQEFLQCFDPAWGRFRNRWNPVPGNHDYGTPNVNGYRQYFGEAATPAGRLYYSLRIGEWLVLMIDSMDYANVGSPQYEFVRGELSTRRQTCTMAVWHHPLFSSGPNGPNPSMGHLWNLLQQNGADVVVVAHDHLYERFAKQDGNGRADARGIRQFTSGTGGAPLYRSQRRMPNSESLASELGVLRLTLRPAGYEWEFLNVGGVTRDSGSDSCH